MSEKKEGIVIRGIGSSTGQRRIVIPESELLFSYVRSSGPGGQKVNKVATKVRLQWRPSESCCVISLSDDDRNRLLDRLGPMISGEGLVQVVSQKFRNRESNRQACRLKLAALVRAGLKKRRKRKPTKPTRASRERRLKEKKMVSKVKKMRGKPGMND